LALVDGPEQLTVEDADNPHGDGLVIPCPKSRAQLGAVTLSVVD